MYFVFNAIAMFGLCGFLLWFWWALNWINLKLIGWLIDVYVGDFLVDRILEFIGGFCGLERSQKCRKQSNTKPRRRNLISKSVKFICLFAKCLILSKHKNKKQNFSKFFIASEKKLRAFYYEQYLIFTTL